MPNHFSKRREDRQRKAEQRAAARTKGFKPRSYWLTDSQNQAATALLQEFFGLHPGSAVAALTGSADFDLGKFQRYVAAMRVAAEPKPKAAAKQAKSDDAPMLGLDWESPIAQ